MADGGLMDLDKHDGPAASAAGGQGSGPNCGGSCSRDLLQKIRLMRSLVPQLASGLERAENIIATHTDNESQDGASLAGSLSSILDTLTDAHSALTEQLTQPSTDHITHKTHGNSNDIGALVSEGLDRTDDGAQHSKAVAVGGGKRARVAIEAAAEAGSVGVCVGAVATQQQGASSRKDHGRPCLSGLPAAVMGHMGSFLTTIDNIGRLSRVNRETHMKATDKTYGVFRNFTMTRREEDTYRKLKTLQNLKDEARTHTRAVETTLGLFGNFADVSVVDDASTVKKMPHTAGKIQAAHVEAREVPPVVSELLEANKDKLKKITLDVEYCYLRRSDAEPIVFSSVTHLDVRRSAGLEFISARRWKFPAVTTLRLGRIGNRDAASLVRLLRESPKIEWLEADRITFDRTQLTNFRDALARCPNLTAISSFRVCFEQLGHISQLKDTLSQHWIKSDKKEVPKTLGIVVEGISLIGVDYGRGKGAADIAGVSEWATDVNCQIVCWPVCLGKLTIDCGSSDAIATPAPGGLYGQIATRLAANATDVQLWLGGTPLDESWRHKLIFHKAKKLTINIKRGASAAEVVDSIPTWLTERQGESQGATSRCFPAVEHLTVSSFSLSLADVRAASSKLSPLLCGLTTLKRVELYGVSSFAAAHELLSFLTVDKLDSPVSLSVTSL
ncbi:unnamed protein product [Vitrella brassicaformis CCMP3155]|uniref:Uncharacterized protein n=2 Tax=Vitrella brassicaformis TaxID=1169539 RepID=A0A0G4ESU4_VITBC|nr:unnamed protein product [Vitrella brassicaformis CCMP3155]|eukprot:CEM01723.1 unnamed protein product [Vitrella brassicaformis CCMP3155]